MKTRSKWIALAAAFGLPALCVGAALATGGDQNDPLVTLSYLEQTALPGVVEQVELKSTARQAELEKALADQISSCSAANRHERVAKIDTSTSDWQA